MEKYKYVILGNSAAAINGIEGIRSVDTEGSILLIARESEHTYSRPLITYRLGGKVDDGRMDYRARDFYAANKVTAWLGVSAERIDAAGRSVTCGDGRQAGFEKLLIATGGSPIRPPIEGLETQGVFTFTTWADQRAMEEYIVRHNVSKAVVLGGGLIGLKSLEALLARKVKCALVELADRVLAITFDQQASQLAQAALAKMGVDLRTNNTVSSVQNQGGRICSVTLKDGSVVPAEMLILAIGVRPDLALLEGSGIKADRGIAVDEQMQTSQPDIYAAGDVAEAMDNLLGAPRPVPILPVAARQGRVAGVNMAGGQAKYDGSVAMNAVDVVGLPTISVGITVEQEGDQVLRELDVKAGVYRKLVIRDERLIGAIFIGQIQRAGIFTGLIRNRVNVSAFKDLLMSDQFGLLSLPAEYRAHMVAGSGIEV